uniref:Uncharacterized protein n=1 Tax=Latimeria chalumnae TaxID=7897 RepID=H3AL68_LATCH
IKAKIMAEEKMSTPQLVHQLAFLNWLRSDTEESKQLLSAVNGIQVSREILRRLTGQDKIDAYKQACILATADFVKKNPRASQKQLNEEVEKQVALFAARVQALKSPVV